MLAILWDKPVGDAGAPVSLRVQVGWISTLSSDRLDEPTSRCDDLVLGPPRSHSLEDKPATESLSLFHTDKTPMWPYLSLPPGSGTRRSIRVDGG